jgi:MoaA/NifB/PqqE/SkfB family radical SAM enzyme
MTADEELGLPPPSERLHTDPPRRYPAGVINVTNRCNLSCTHCSLYREGNPNDERDQIPGESRID